MQWVELMFDSIHRACDSLQGQPEIEANPSDPLHVVLRVGLSDPIDAASRAPFRYLVRAWAQVNDAEVKRIVLDPHQVEIEVFIKYRGGGPCHHTLWEPGPRPLRRGGSANASASRRRRRRR